MMPKGFSYLTEEVNSFLNLLEEYLPISTTAWERVAEVHLTWYCPKPFAVVEEHWGGGLSQVYDYKDDY